MAEVRPSWWGYFWHLFFFWLIVPPIVAYVHRISTVRRIFPDRITLARGLLSKCYQDYNPRDIRSLDVDQSFLQRLVGIGDLTISTAATAEGSEQVKSIPDPLCVRDLIRGPARGPVTHFWVKESGKSPHDTDPIMFENIRRMHAMIVETGLQDRMELMVDGGVKTGNVAAFIQSGMNVGEFSSPLLKGPSGKFAPGTGQIEAAVKRLRAVMDEASIKESL